MADDLQEPLHGWRELPQAEMLDKARTFYETMKRRRTVRDFSSRPVPRALIESALLRSEEHTSELQSH